MIFFREDTSCFLSTLDIHDHLWSSTFGWNFEKTRFEIETNGWILGQYGGWVCVYNLFSLLVFGNGEYGTKPLGAFKHDRRNLQVKLLLMCLTLVTTNKNCTMIEKSAQIINSNTQRGNTSKELIQSTCGLFLPCYIIGVYKATRVL